MMYIYIYLHCRMTVHCLYIYMYVYIHIDACWKFHRNSMQFLSIHHFLPLHFNPPSFEIQFLLFLEQTNPQKTSPFVLEGGDFAGGWEMHSEIFLELVERLLGCIDSLEPRGLSMTAYSAAKLLFGDYRRAETYVDGTQKKQGVVGESSVGFKVMERGKIARNTLFVFFDCLHPKLSKTYCVTYNDHYYERNSWRCSFLLSWFVGKQMILPNNPPFFYRKPIVLPFISSHLSPGFGLSWVLQVVVVVNALVPQMLQKPPGPLLSTLVWCECGALWVMDVCVPQNDGSPTWLEDKKNRKLEQIWVPFAVILDHSHDFRSWCLLWVFQGGLDCNYQATIWSHPLQINSLGVMAFHLQYSFGVVEFWQAHDIAMLKEFGERKGISQWFDAMTTSAL